MILLCNLDSEYKINYSYGHYNMFGEMFQNAKFIDVYPNFNIKNGYGRIIMFNWNNFLRKIKKFLLNKKKKNLKIFLIKLEKLDNYLIHNILKYI